MKLRSLEDTNMSAIYSPLSVFEAAVFNGIGDICVPESPKEKKLSTKEAFARLKFKH